MLFMLRMSFEILPLAFLSLELWAGVAALAVLAVFVQRRITSQGSRGRLIELSALIPIPVIILVWGLYFWPSGLSARGPHERAALVGVRCFAAVQLLVAAWLVWRRPARLELATGLACLALLWTAAAQFVASMAITNTWL